MNIKDLQTSPEKEYIVTNRSGSKVIMNIPSLGVRREFNPQQSMTIQYRELEAFSFTPGGKNLMYNYLKIEDPELETGDDPEIDPEYYYTEEDVKRILVSGTLDEFLDLLDFAPMGVMDMVKDLSITLPLNDVAKREALQEKTGFNVGAAIENLKNDDGEIEVSEKKTRRASKTSNTTSTKKTRRASTKKTEE